LFAPYPFGVLATSYQYFFSPNKSVTGNQSTVLFSQTNHHQPLVNNQLHLAVFVRVWHGVFLKVMFSHLLKKFRLSVTVFSK
jgi:hypothetical protein